MSPGQYMSSLLVLIFEGVKVTEAEESYDSKI